MKLITSSKFQFFFFGLISVGWLACNCRYVRTFVGSKKEKRKRKSTECGSVDLCEFDLGF